MASREKKADEMEKVNRQTLGSSKDFSDADDFSAIIFSPSAPPLFTLFIRAFLF